MFNQVTSAAAEQATISTLSTSGLTPEQQAEAIRVCSMIAWRVAPLDELEDRLEGEVGLEPDKASAVAARLRQQALPAWQKLWEELDEHQRDLNHHDLHNRFEEWSESITTDVKAAAVEFDQLPSLAITLERSLNEDHQLEAITILDYLAQKGRLLATVAQIRDIREGFDTWLKEIDNAKDITPPLADQWNAPLISLLLQYLVEVRLGFSHEDAALIASVIAQHLATASGKTELATIVYGDGSKNEFMWRPVRVVDGRVEFID